MRYTYFLWNPKPNVLSTSFSTSSNKLAPLSPQSSNLQPNKTTQLYNSKKFLDIT